MFHQPCQIAVASLTSSRDYFCQYGLISVGAASSGCFRLVTSNGFLRLSASHKRMFYCGWLLYVRFVSMVVLAGSALFYVVVWVSLK